LFAGDAPSGEAEWGVARALLVMMVATAVIAVQAELVSAALEDASAQLRLSPLFLGAVVLALVGTVSDLFAAVVFARQDKMDIVFTICIGSSIQTALVMAPVLVLAS
jgi:Ca2+:H+ antiporter